MLRALWFMAKLGLLVAVAVWVAEQPGTVEFEWKDYTIRFEHLGLFLLVVLGGILLSIFVYNVIRTFVDFPKSYRRYREVKRFEKGYKALTLGLTSVAAGDAKSASYQSHRVEKLLEGDNGLPLLLKAQAARMRGDEAEARQSFLQLLENKDAAFLGARGLLQVALDMDDDERALELAYKALEIHPKQPWILKTVYDMEVRLHRWEDALKTLLKAEKYGAIEKDKAVSDRVAILHAQVEVLLQNDQRDEALKVIGKAYKLDKGFVPTITLLARLTHQSGKRGKAVKLVEKAWKENPHADLAKAWEDLISRDRSKKPLGRVQWFERLLAKNSEDVQGHMAAGRIATEEGLWGEARKYFEQAEAIEPNSKLYHLWAALEDKSGHEDAAQIWLEKADEAPAVSAWVCGQTGRIYDQWQPIAQPHGAFNSIIWAVPQNVGVIGKLSKAGQDKVVLEAPETVKSKAS